MMTPEVNQALISLAESTERLANTVDVYRAGFEGAVKSFTSLVDRIAAFMIDDPEFAHKAGLKFAQAFKAGMMGMDG